MEHRYTGRESVEVSVVISCPRIGLIRGTATNVGLGGMFVALDSVVMPLNAPVTLSFQPSADDSVVCLHVPGMVVHQHAGGVGVMFGELEPSCKTAIRGLLGALTPDQPDAHSRRSVRA